MTRAKRLVVTESTYSWWAAFIGATPASDQTLMTSTRVEAYVVRGFPSRRASYVAGAADEVHAPGMGVVPIPVSEPRYVFHDIHNKRYWGRFERGQNKVVYTPGADPGAQQ